MPNTNAADGVPREAGVYNRNQMCTESAREALCSSVQRGSRRWHGRMA